MYPINIDKLHHCLKLFTALVLLAGSAFRTGKTHHGSDFSDFVPLRSELQYLPASTTQLIQQSAHPLQFFSV
ncbi:MAG: hypothetical protein AAF206_21630 [Bacteroidota bacterium]